MSLIPLKGMRGAIARNMTAGWQAPRVAMTMHVDMSACLTQKVSVTAQVLCAVAGALRNHPMLNAWLTPDGIAVQSEVNLGMAVALSEGLAVPVIRNAAVRSLTDMAQQVRELAAAARQQSLPPKAFQGGSFTVTNLGATGIDWFTPILNPPQVGILGIGRTLETPVVREGQIVIAPMMSMTLVFDHRAVDGYPAALFMADLRKRLEAGVCHEA
jgi:pyruvate/2-oxoglutarate dehydrogenase complex dihydrolipoamide acyltransferase (E2) component